MDIAPTPSIAAVLPCERNTALLDIPGAANFLGLTPWQIRGLLANGELRCVRVGRKIYFRRATLIRWTENAEEKYKVA